MRGKLAGIDVLRIVNEPTAASLAYGLGLNKEGEKTLAVYDLGGGTFDISILKIVNGIFEVLSTNGDTYLGGDDFDNAIIDYWKKENNIGAEQITDKSFSQSLRLKAEEAKKYLSVNDEFIGEIGGNTFKITRDKFNELIQPLIDKTIKNCASALKDAGLTQKDIDEVVMVGGSTRVPLVKQSVKQFFQREVHDRLNPDEVVALGAAVQADILSGNNKEFYCWILHHFLWELKQWVG